MGLKEAFQKAAATAFNAAGNVKKTVTYTTNPTASYDTSTGQVTSGGTEYSITVLPESFSIGAIGASEFIYKEGYEGIKPGDQKLSILNEDITFTPDFDDVVTIDGTDWRVVGKHIDPAEAIWTLHIRQ